jgi:hypothetical protein
MPGPVRPFAAWQVLIMASTYSSVLSFAEGNAPWIHYKINGYPYNKCYYLTDDIYLEWYTFMKIIREPIENTNRIFAKQQEAYRKDVERAFSVLQFWQAVV